jgi:hypothetical protein
MTEETGGCLWCSDMIDGCDTDLGIAAARNPYETLSPDCCSTGRALRHYAGLWA